MTITLTAKAWREAIVTQLTARSVGTVVHARVRDIPDDDIPAGSALINVFSPGNRGTSSGGKQSHLPRFNHSERVVIACALRLADGVARTSVDKARADAIDDLETSIIDALFTNRAFNEVAFSGYVVEKGGSVRAGAQRGDLVIELIAEWHRKCMPGPEPGTPDPIFRQVLVQYDMDGNEVYTVPPEPAHIVDGIYPMLDWRWQTQSRNTMYLGLFG